MTNLNRAPGALTLPLIILAIYALVRVSGFEPQQEGLGDHVTALFLIFGASTAYLGFLDSRRMWWWFSSILLLTLAADEVFMLHESFECAYGLSEMYVFATYLLSLSALLVWNASITLGFSGKLLVAAMTLFGLAVLSDQMLNEAVLEVAGFPVDVEQLLECFGALSLSSAFASHLLDD